jgi:hypothetical protein
MNPHLVVCPPLELFQCHGVVFCGYYSPHCCLDGEQSSQGGGISVGANKRLSYRKGPWTPEEVLKLKEAAAQYLATGGSKQPMGVWNKISEAVGTRSPQQCDHKWYSAVEPEVVNDQLRTGKFSAKEDASLAEAVELLGTSNWAAIAKQVGTRSRVACRQRWKNRCTEVDEAVTKGKFSEEEEKRLRDAVAMYNGKNWKDIAKYVGKRTPMQCSFHWSDMQSKEFEGRGHWKSGRFTEAEDQLLLEGVEKFGTRNWGGVAEVVQTRRPHDCSGRWRSYLAFKVAGIEYQTGPYSEEEDKLIREGVATHGEGNWKAVAAHVKSRRPKDCTNRWHKHLKFLHDDQQQFNSYQFSVFEDAAILEGVKKWGDSGHWGEIAREVGSRPPAACRSRWNYVLKFKNEDQSHMRSGKFSEEEDRLLCQGVSRYLEAGGWSAVAAHVKSRKAKCCTARWGRLKRAASEAGKTPSEMAEHRMQERPAMGLTVSDPSQPTEGGVSDPRHAAMTPLLSAIVAADKAEFSAAKTKDRSHSRDGYRKEKEKERGREKRAVSSQDGGRNPKQLRVNI